jgi:hypothetical protein
MANNIALAQRYINDPENFNAVFKRESLTGLLETQRVNFLDANTIKAPNRKFSTYTLGDYNRATGATGVDLVEEWDTYTLTQDKGEFLYLDVMDDEETLGDGLIARANARNREVVVPSVDKYRFGVLATVPTPAADPTVVGAKIITAAAATVDTAVELVDNAHEYMEENEVPIDGTVLYVTPAFRKKMQRSKDIQKNFGVRDVTLGGITTQFDEYNGSVIVTVPTARLGANIEFILVNPLAITTVVKFNESRLVDATATTNNLFGNYWKFRLYHDLFLSKGKAIIEGSGATKTLVNPGVYVKKIGA